MTPEEIQKIKNAIAMLRFWSIRYGASGSSFYEDAIKRAEITLFVAIYNALSSDPSDLLATAEPRRRSRVRQVRTVRQV